MKYLYLLPLVILCSAVAAYGQDGTPGKVVTMDEAVSIGLRRNISVVQSDLEVDRAVSYKTQAVGAFLPDLSASARWSRSDRDNIAFRQDDFVVSRNQYSYSINSNLTIFDGLRNIGLMNQGLIALDAANYNSRWQKEATTLSIQEAYYNVLRLQQLVKVNQSNLERTMKQLERIREMNKVGSIPLADVYRQQVEAGKAELEALQSVNNLNNAKIDLLTLIGMSSDELVDFQDPSIGTTITDAEIEQAKRERGNHETLVKTAYENRADYIAAGFSKESYEEGIRVARGGHYPTLSAFASYSWGNIELADFTDFATASYGLQLFFPIFSNFETTAGVQRAQIDVRNSEETLLNLKRTIGANLRKALNDIEYSERNIAIARQTLQSANMDYSIANERYNVGSGTLLDLTVASTNLISAESNMVNASFEYLAARKRLAHQMGLPLMGN